MGFGNLDGMFLFHYGRLHDDIVDVRSYFFLQCTLSFFDYVHFGGFFFSLSHLCYTYKAIRVNFFICLLYVFGVEYTTCILALSVYFYSLFFITGCNLFFFATSCLVLCLYCYFRILYEGLASFSYVYGCVFRAVISSCFLLFCFDFMVYVVLVVCFLYFSFFPNYFCGFGCFGFVIFFIDYFSKDCISVGFFSILGPLVVFNSLGVVKFFFDRLDVFYREGRIFSFGFILFFVNLLLVFFSWYVVLFVEDFRLFFTFNHRVLSYFLIIFIFFSLSVTYDPLFTRDRFRFIEFSRYKGPRF